MRRLPMGIVFVGEEDATVLKEAEIHETDWDMVLDRILNPVPLPISDVPEPSQAVVGLSH